MKYVRFYLPEIGFAALLLVILYLRYANVLGKGQPTLIILTLLVLYLFVNKMRGPRRPRVPAPEPELDSPGLFRTELCRYCRENMKSFKAVPVLLSKVPGPVESPPHTSLSAPRELEIYIESYDGFPNVFIVVHDFFEINQGCLIKGVREIKTSAHSAQRFEAFRKGFSGQYAVMVSPAEIPNHYRIQIGRHYDADAA